MLTVPAIAGNLNLRERPHQFGLSLSLRPALYLGELIQLASAATVRTASKLRPHALSAPRVACIRSRIESRQQSTRERFSQLHGEVLTRCAELERRSLLQSG